MKAPTMVVRPDALNSNFLSCCCSINKLAGWLFGRDVSEQPWAEQQGGRPSGGSRPHSARMVARRAVVLCCATRAFQLGQRPNSRPDVNSPLAGRWMSTEIINNKAAVKEAALFGVN